VLSVRVTAVRKLGSTANTRTRSVPGKCTYGSTVQRMAFPERVARIGTTDSRAAIDAECLNDQLTLDPP
jgi:hypothetical protein